MDLHRIHHLNKKVLNCLRTGIFSRTQTEGLELCAWPHFYSGSVLSACCLTHVVEAITIHDLIVPAQLLTSIEDQCPYTCGYIVR